MTRTTDASVTAGYKSNVVGFGWTNGAFLVMLHALIPEDQKRLLTPSKQDPVVIRSTDWFRVLSFPDAQPSSEHQYIVARWASACLY